MGAADIVPRICLDTSSENISSGCAVVRVRFANKLIISPLSCSRTGSHDTSRIICRVDHVVSIAFGALRCVVLSYFAVRRIRSALLIHPSPISDGTRDSYFTIPCLSIL